MYAAPANQRCIPRRVEAEARAKTKNSHSPSEIKSSSPVRAKCSRRVLAPVMKVANFFPSDFPSTTQSKRACVRARACTAPFQRMAEFRPSRAESRLDSFSPLRKAGSIHVSTLCIRTHPLKRGGWSCAWRND